jgi:hypothetical protein
MAERNPLTNRFGLSQGRLKPSTFRCLDGGEYAFILGDELQNPVDVNIGDNILVKQDLDLTGVDVIRVDLGFLQPLTMPEARDVAGHNPGTGYIYTASLVKANVFPASLFPERIGHPKTFNAIKQPYAIVAGSTLRVAIDGVNEDIVFAVGGSKTAQEVVTVINGLATNFTASVENSPADPYILLTADGSNYPENIEVVTIPGNPDLDANTELGFYQKVARPLASNTAIYGGDNLSAISGVDCLFTTADLYKPIEITGAVNVSNNGYNRVIHILSNGSIGVLEDEVIAEGPGFSAELIGALWKFSILVGTWTGFSTTFWRGAQILSNDIAVNVSKMTGTNTVTFKLELIQD